MDDITLKGLGMYLIAIVSAFMVFGVFFIGHSVNGIPVELAAMFASMLGATEVFIILIIKHFCKIQE